MKRIRLLLAAVAAMVGLSVNAQQTPVNEGVYYLYNTETGKFLTRGNTYGTQAVTNDFGSPWQVTVSNGNYILRMYDIVAGGGTSGLGSNGYSDNGNPLEFTPSGDANGYKLKNGTNYLCSPDTYGNNVLNSDENYNSTWQFLNVSEYNAVLAAKTTAQESAIATTAGITLGSSTLSAIVTDADNWRHTDAGSYAADKTNWAVSSVANRAGNVNSGSYGVEIYQGGGTLSRTISGLAKGIYKVSVKAMLRSASNAICSTVGDAGYVNSSAYFSANGNLVQIKDWYSSRTDAGNPNSTGAFVTIANNGGYLSEVYAYVGDAGTLELKAVSESYWGASWFLFNGVTLTYYSNSVSDEDIAALIATIPAEGTVPATVYSNLTTLKNTLESAKTIAAFNALSEAVAAANALVSPYATLVAEVAKAKALGMEAADADAYLDGFTTPAQATANTQALMVDEYNYVVGNYTVAIDLGTWTTQNAGTMTSQHWDGTTTSSYNEQNEGWNSGNAWSTSYSQTITLPAGEYVFKVAGRHSQSSVLTLSVTEGETIIGTVNDFPAGDTGRGINTSGATDFSDGGTYARNGAGGGWQWRYVPFTLTESTNVTISVVGSNPNSQWYQWCSFCNYTVQAKPSVAASKIAYEQAVANANTALANSTYANVGGTDRSNLETAVAETPEETIEWYDTQKALVDDYLTTFTAGVANWNSYAKSLVAKAEADLISTSICESISLSVPTTAAAAAIAAEEQYTVRELTANYVSTNYTYPLTTVIGDFSTWTATAKYNTGGDDIDDIPQTNSSEHWSGETRDYYEQGKEGWGASHGFNCTYTKTATLPAGNYIVKVAARASGDVTGTISASATANTVTLPNAGATSKGIDLSGAANYGDGEFAREGVGFGWEWRFLPFTLAEDGEVTITIHESTTATHNWFSLADAVLLSDEAKFIPATAEDYANLNTAIETAINTHVYGFEAGEYAPYNNIEAAATIAAAQAIDQAAENAQENVQAAIAAVNNATWTANETEVNAIYNGDFAIAAHDGASNPQPTGWYRNVGTYTGDGYNVRYVTIPSGVEGNTSEKGLFGKFTMMYGAEEGYTLPLKAGYYKLTFMYGGWNEVGEREIRLYNDDNNATVATSTVKAANNTGHNKASSWRAYSSIITVPAAGNYTLSFYRQNTSSQNQLVLTDIVLVKATAADFKGALLAEITTASAVDVTTNVGEGVFQIPAAAATALTTAISDAQTVYNNADATIDEVLAATESVPAAVETYNNAELNAPNEEAIYNIVVATEGHAKAGNPMIVVPGTSGSNNPTGYALNANLAANKNLSQAFKFTKVSGNLYLISAQQGEGRVYMTNGTLNGSAAGWKASQIQFTTDEEKAMQFKIEAVANAVAFKIYNTETNTTVDCQTGGNIYTEGNNTLFTVTETTRPNIVVNTTAAGYGTTMLPFAVAQLPEGVKVYTCADTEGDVLTLTEADAIEANKPYIIEGAWEAVLTGDAQGKELTTTDGLLTGVYAETAAPVGSFVLQNNEKVGFYRVAEGKQPTVGANHAYLTEEAGARAAYFFGEGVTNGINAIEALTEGNVGIFNAAGVQQPRLQKGLNIVKKADGTSFKVMVK